MVKVDISGIEGGKYFKDPTRGNYNVESVDYSTFQTSEDSNHPNTDYWSIHWMIQDNEEFEGQYIFDSVMLPCIDCLEAGELVDGHRADKKGNTNYPLFGLYNILRATIGQHKWSDEELDKGQLEIEAEDLMGLKVKVRYGKQKNSDFMNIKKYMPIDDGEDDDLLP